MVKPNDCEKYKKNKEHCFVCIRKDIEWTEEDFEV